MNPFKNKKIRSCYDKTNRKHWFSVVDIVSALRNCDYATARNYWKWLKRNLQKNQPVSQLVSEYTQLPMQAADGKLRDTDVMDAAEILQLISQFPSPNAGVFKLWVVALIAEGKNVVKCAEEAISKAKDMARCKVGNLLKTIRRREFDVLGDLPQIPNPQRSTALFSIPNQLIPIPVKHRIILKPDRTQNLFGDLSLYITA